MTRIASVIDPPLASGNGRLVRAIPGSCAPFPDKNWGLDRFSAVLVAGTYASDLPATAIAPQRATVPGGNSNGRFTVNGSLGCQWTPSTTDLWLTIAGFSSISACQGR